MPFHDFIQLTAVSALGSRQEHGGGVCTRLPLIAHQQQEADSSGVPQQAGTHGGALPGLFQSAVRATVFSKRVRQLYLPEAVLTFCHAAPAPRWPCQACDS